MTFFKNNKKAKEINEILESGDKLPKDLDDAVKIMKDAAPKAADRSFADDLKKKLMAAHSAQLAGDASEEVEETKEAPHKKVLDKIKSWNPFNGWSFKPRSFAPALIAVLVVIIGSYPLVPAPRVQGYTQAGRTVQISYNAPIKIRFNQWMAHGSVEDAFKIEPEVEGSFDWSGSTMMFYPNDQFEENEIYKVTIKQDAKSLFFKNMAFDYIENFKIIGPPKATLITPADGTDEVPVESKVTFSFDRPVRALEPLNEIPLSDLGITIEPSLNGRVKLLGSSAFQFIPERLNFATRYKVTLAKGLETVDGGTTEDDYVIEFETEKPRVTGFSPRSGKSNLGPESEIRINFNQPMDLGKLGNSISLYKLEDDEIGDNAKNGYLNLKLLEGLNFSEEGRVKVNTSFRYVDMDDPSEKESIEIKHGLRRDHSKDYVIVDPNGDLPLDTTFALIVRHGLNGAEGEIGTEETRKHFFKTAGPLKISSTYPENDESKANASSISLLFNNPIKEYEEGELDKFVHVSQDPKADAWTPTVQYYNRRSLYIGGGIRPSMDYEVTIKAGIEDEYGQKLQEDYSFSFRTADLSARFEIPSPYSVNILDSSQPIEYFAKTVNIKKAFINFRELTEEEFSTVYSRGYLDLRNNPIEGPFDLAGIDLNYKFNERQFTRINLEKELNRSIGPGIYYMEAWSNEYTDRNGIAIKKKIVMMVSDAALTYKHSKDHTLVWATSMKDGSPMAGMPIKILSMGGETLSSGVTNKDGIFESRLKDPDTKSRYSHPEFNIMGGGSGNFAFLSSTWSEGVSSWNFGISSSYLPQSHYSVIYTERPLYRPGDTVSFKGIIRQAGNSGLELPDGNLTSLEIEDSRGNTVYQEKLAINSNGTFNGEFTLESSASTGRYRVTSMMYTGVPDRDHISYGSFTINEYKKPDYKVTLTPKEENFVQGDKLEIDVTGEFFFGAALSNAPVSWTAKSQDYYFNSYEGDLWYSFSEEGYLCYWGCSGRGDIVGEGQGELDSSGNYKIAIDVDFEEKNTSQFYTIEATVFDKNNQSVSNRSTIPIHQGEYYVGIANDDYVVSEGDDAKFNVIAVDYDGAPIFGKNIEVSFYERQWNTVKKKNVDGGFYYENDYVDSLISRKSATTNNQGKAQIAFNTDRGGLFRAVATSKDGRGNEIIAGTNVYVSSSKFVYWGFDNNDRIEMVPDKQEYSVGDTAKILIKSPFENVSALVTYEREDIIHSEVIKIESNSHTIEVDITEDFLPNMFVSVALFKGSSHTAGLPELDDSENERNVAAFKVGYATLHVDTDTKKMDIGLSLNKSNDETYLPGEEVTIYVTTKDSNGNAQAAEVSVAVVDESVLSLSNKFIAELLKVFYRNRNLNVTSAFSMTKALSRINVQIEAGLKGGGGGHADKRDTFKDTAFWNATVQTDSDGNGQVTFTLPDNLTSWEVLAIGVSKDSSFGSTRISFKTQKDVMIRPVLPRFLSVDDQFKAGAIVHNNTNKEMSLSVSIMSEELELKSGSEQTVKLAAKEQKKLLWDMAAPHDPSIKSVTINILAKDKGGSAVGDQLEITLPLKGSSFPEHVATSGSIKESITKIEAMHLPEELDKSLAKLQVDLAPTFVGSLANGLEVNISYPYECSEQTASRILPNVKAKQLIGLPIVPDDLIDMDELDSNVKSSVSRLYGLQQTNGAWGLWSNSKPSPYVTAYVVMALGEASNAGYTVDRSVINRGIDYLHTYMRTNALKGDYISYEANQRAFMLFVLSELDRGDLGLSNNLYEHRVHLSIFGKAYLAMSFDNLGSSNKANLLKDSILTLREDTPRGISFSETTRHHALFDTDVRSTAIVLQMLVRVDPNNDVIDKIIRYLLAERRGYGWETTQESAITLTALVEYLQSSDESNPNFEARVDVNKEEIINTFFTADNIDVVTGFASGDQLNNGDTENEIAITHSGTGKLYYDIVLEYFLPVEQIKERNEGMIIYHEYFNVDDEDELNPVHEAKAGHNLKAQMTVIVPADRFYVAVEDFLPAGLEPVDFSLKTSQQSLNDEAPAWARWMNNTWRFNHKEFRDDRVVYFADFLPKGVYEIEYYVRATTPGEFVDLPATAYQMYYPEVFGQTRGYKFKVSE